MKHIAKTDSTSELIDACVLLASIVPGPLEKAGPTDLVDSLNRLLEFLASSVEKNSGALAQITPYSLTAYWSKADGVPKAAGAAIEMMEKSREELGKVWQMTGTEWHLRCAILSGKVLAGTIGPAGRRQLFLMGETIDHLQMIMRKTEGTAARIVIGGAEAEVLHTKFEVSELEQMMLKGRSAPLLVFELIGP